MTRFRQVSERYVPGDHATTYVATAEVQPGHIVTRTRVWSDHFGPVPGSHHVTYDCTCGAHTIGQHAHGPRLSDLDRLTHYGSEAERQAAESAEAERLARTLRTLGMDTPA